MPGALPLSTLVDRQTPMVMRRAWGEAPPHHGSDFPSLDCDVAVLTGKHHMEGCTVFFQIPDSERRRNPELWAETRVSRRKRWRK